MMILFGTQLMEFSAHVKHCGHNICTDAQNRITNHSLSICASQGANTLSKYWEQLGGARVQIVK